MGDDRTIFSREDLNLLREWFNALQDATPQYLEEKDLRLYEKILEALDWPNQEDLRRASERTRDRGRLMPVRNKKPRTEQ